MKKYYCPICGETFEIEEGESCPICGADFSELQLVEE